MHFRRESCGMLWQRLELEPWLSDLVPLSIFLEQGHPGHDLWDDMAVTSLHL